MSISIHVTTHPVPRDGLRDPDYPARRTRNVRVTHGRWYIITVWNSSSLRKGRLRYSTKVLVSIKDLFARQRSVGEW